MADPLSPQWPELPYDAWQDTRATLHLWTQVVGKIRLQQTPWLNHSWHVTLYVTSKGLTTSPIPHGPRSFEIEFDFNQHVLDITVSDGNARRLPLRPQSVADFYAALMAALRELGVACTIKEAPCEIPGATPFSQDQTHAAYEAEDARRFWLALVQIDRVFKQFRTAFLGKCSPVHFFWGSFDLAVTRFSGRRAPRFPGSAPGLAPEVMQEAYSHEESSAGFWPGGNGIDYPAFYSYAYPAPAGFRDAVVQPAAAFFSEKLGEFLLPYDAVRNAADPDAELLAFLQSTYEAAARAGAWDRAALECPRGVPGVPRDTPS
ncbi:MAG TPA: DUF5996 family protein [Steroidobacteraceae bacterium]|jgi:hypothetical protein|nr:DUF5996 family protein [Steroidobacteraceae bacterium]